MLCGFIMYYYALLMASAVGKCHTPEISRHFAAPSPMQRRPPRGVVPHEVFACAAYDGYYSDGIYSEQPEAVFLKLQKAFVTHLA